MSNLPKYYFGDIPAVVMAEIMDEMLRLKPEPELSDLEEVDDWLNRKNHARTIPGWCESVGEFLSDVRAEYRSGAERAGHPALFFYARSMNPHHPTKSPLCQPSPSHLS